MQLVAKTDNEVNLLGEKKCVLFNSLRPDVSHKTTS